MTDSDSDQESSNSSQHIDSANANSTSANSNYDSATTQFFEDTTDNDTSSDDWEQPGWHQPQWMAHYNPVGHVFPDHDSIFNDPLGHNFQGAEGEYSSPDSYSLSVTLTHTNLRDMLFRTIRRLARAAAPTRTYQICYTHLHLQFIRIPGRRRTARSPPNG
jgi:hypothetical protein